MYVRMCALVGMNGDAQAVMVLYIQYVGMRWWAWVAAVGSGGWWAVARWWTA